MFDNIGGKIKSLAVITCVLGIIASVIGAITLWSAHSAYNPTIALGLGVLIGGSVASWIGSFFTYGFGQLIEDTEQIRTALNDMKHPAPKRNAVAEESRSSFIVPTVSTNTQMMSGDRWKCKSCGQINLRSDLFCKGCGEYK